MGPLGWLMVNPWMSLVFGQLAAGRTNRAVYHDILLFFRYIEHRTDFGRVLREK